MQNLEQNKPVYTVTQKDYDYLRDRFDKMKVHYSKVIVENEQLSSHKKLVEDFKAKIIAIHSAYKDEIRTIKEKHRKETAFSEEYYKSEISRLETKLREKQEALDVYKEIASKVSA